MCGIFGLIRNNLTDFDKNFANRITNKLFQLSETRGKEASGIAIYNNGTKQINVFKRNIRATKMIKDNEYKSFINKSLGDVFSNGNMLALVGHCRMVTNGSQEYSYNNQPVVKHGKVCVHNGIIVNDNELWEKYGVRSKRFDIDTEIILEVYNNEISKHKNYAKALSQIYSDICGEATLAILNNDNDKMLLSTNTGSLYTLIHTTENMIIFSSERFILRKLKESFNDKLAEYSIKQIKAGSGCIIDLKSCSIQEIEIHKTKAEQMIETNFHEEFDVNIDAIDMPNIKHNHSKSDEQYLKSLLQYNDEEIKHLKKCTKCLLPETFPFIEYDDKGICNYCKNHIKYKTQGKEKLKELINAKLNKNNNNKCLMAFSGGRDSCYGLDYIYNEVGIEAIAYTYDWGMVTDLGRRNQARLCGELGAEHIIVSADIEKKRKNIKQNVEAWLKKPSLGTIPLFMAGDKQYFYYANKIAKDNNLDDLVILCDNPLEVTFFKAGFAGVRPNFYNNKQHYSQSVMNKLRMIGYYLKEFIQNPYYINSSVLDTIGGFISYYFIPHNYINLYNYIEWDEETVNKTLRERYNWEISLDTTTTWRIGDGTAAFYNYIYYTVAGFTENDTIRSMQIREGKLKREHAIELVKEENKPRFESIKWYLDVIDVDYKRAISIINNIQKLYR